MLVVVALLFAALALRRPVGADGQVPWAPPLIDGALAVVFGAARLALVPERSRRWVIERVQAVGLVLCLLASAEVLSTLVVGDDAGHGAAVIIFLVATGAQLQDRRYAALVVVVAVAEWLGVAVAHDLAGDWARVTVMVAMACVVAGVLNASRRRLADRLLALQSSVRSQAVTDDLTGLANRRGLLEAGRRAVAHAGAPGVAVLVLDVDGLKAVNDAWGHADGDRLLRHAAAALRSATRPDDVVARLGGDEFAVVLHEPDDAVVDAVREASRRALDAAGVHASIGWARGTAGQGIEDVLKAADHAMYVVKRSRRTPPSDAVATRPSRPAPGAPGPVQALTAGSPASADLRDLAVAGSVVHALMVPLDLVLLPGRAGWQMSLVALGMTLGLAALRVTMRHPATSGVVQRRAPELLALAMALVCAESVLLVLVSGQLWTSTALLVALIATGGLVLSPALVGAIHATAVGAWAAAVAGGQVEGDWEVYGGNVLAATLAAWVLNRSQRTTYRRLGDASAQACAAAQTDELSGLRNRNGFARAAAPLVQACTERGDGASVLFLDLDGLKLVNDAHGHDAGDQLIATAAEVLMQCAGPTDVCARFGGDEFTVLLDRCDPAGVPARVQHLRESLAARRVSASIGVAHLGRDAPTLEALLERADASMYRSRALERAAAPAGRDVLA